MPTNELNNGKDTGAFARNKFKTTLRPLQDSNNLNAVNQYMTEITQIPLLTPEEEFNIGMRIWNGAQERTKGEGQEQAIIADGQQAQKELYLANLRLVVPVAKKYAEGSTGQNLLDYIQEGNVGLMRAAEKFDPTQGFRFSTYATWWITQGVYRAWEQQRSLVHIPRPLRDAMRTVRREQTRMMQELGRVPTVAELADSLSVDKSLVQEALVALERPVSIDEPLSDETDLTTADGLINDTDDSTTYSIQSVEERETVRQLLESLSERERTVLILRYGLDGQEPMGFLAIGKQLGISRERARQVGAVALAKLRESEGVIRSSGS